MLVISLRCRILPMAPVTGVIRLLPTVMAVVVALAVLVTHGVAGAVTHTLHHPTGSAFDVTDPGHHVHGDGGQAPAGQSRRDHGFSALGGPGGSRAPASGLAGVQEAYVPQSLTGTASAAEHDGASCLAVGAPLLLAAPGSRCGRTPYEDERSAGAGMPAGSARTDWPPSKVVLTVLSLLLI